MRQSRILTLFLAGVTALFILCSSLAVPILLRPFYYAHIEPLQLEECSGLNREQIVTAYDDVMDFCTGRTGTFSAGGLSWTAAGRDHFSDVRGLFLLTLRTAPITGLILLARLLFRKKLPLHPRPLLGRGFAFWGSIGLCAAGGLIAIPAILDFEQTFLLFHHLFFPGKTNWYFNPHLDAVITILPQTFFQNCAILVLALILLQCTVYILLDLRRKA